jgi:hypothetical protein
MKGKLGFFGFFENFWSLHMKRNEAFFENEKYFNFLKMDIFDVQKNKAWLFSWKNDSTLR